MSRQPYDPACDNTDATWALVEILGETFRNMARRPDDSRVSVVDALYNLADALRGHTNALRELARGIDAAVEGKERS